MPPPCTVVYSSDHTEVGLTRVDLACLRKVYLRRVKVLWTEKSNIFLICVSYFKILNPIQRWGF